MSQAGGNNTSNSPGVVNSVTGANGVTASPTTGAVVVSGVNATTTTVGVASFNSADFTVNGSGQVTLIGTGGAPIQTITGNSGGAEVPSSGNFNFLTANSTVKFVGTAATETLDFGLSNLLLGSLGSSISSGASNTGLGFHALERVSLGSSNVAVGFSALFATTTGDNNTAIGGAAGTGLISGSRNVLVGTATVAGSAGNDNTVIGYSSGTSLATIESSNILIKNIGNAADNNTIRIGTQGSGAGQQNTCIIAGIVGVTTSNTQAVTIDSTTGQLGVTTFAPTYAYTATAISYQVLITNKIIGVTSNASARTITMPNAGMVAGQSWTIKDQAGTAQSANNITISGNGANIDGASTFVINTNYGSATLYFDGTNFFII